MAEGTGVCVVRGAAVGLAVAVAGRFVGAGDAVPVRVADCVGEACAPWVAVGRGEAVAVPVCAVVDVPDGVNIDGAVVDCELVHAQTVTATRTIEAAQLRAVSLPLATVPRVIMRAFMRLPYLLGRRP